MIINLLDHNSADLDFLNLTNKLNLKVTKMKNDLYNGVYDGASEEWLNGAHYSLNQVLEVINEYSQ